MDSLVKCLSIYHNFSRAIGIAIEIVYVTVILKKQLLIVASEACGFHETLGF